MMPFLKTDDVLLLNFISQCQFILMAWLKGIKAKSIAIKACHINFDFTKKYGQGTVNDSMLDD